MSVPARSNFESPIEGSDRDLYYSKSEPFCIPEPAWPRGKNNMGALSYQKYHVVLASQN